MIENLRPKSGCVGSVTSTIVPCSLFGLWNGVLSCGIVRQGKPRHADGESGGRGERQTSAKADPRLSGKRCDGEWSSDYASYNIAKRMIEFPVNIPRNRLRAGYGDGFGGAPLSTLPTKTNHPRNRGASTDGAGAEETTNVEGEAHV